jgi:NNP family nitrate/nitrite transporter-like MFS transporter
VAALVAMQVPVAGILGVVAYRIHDAGALSATGLDVTYGALAAFLVWQVAQVLKVNRPVLRGEPADHAYPFTPVVLLSLAYGITFGAELAVVSLLPTFFAATFGLEIGAASAAGSAFAFTNLVTRPGGGLLSDVTRRRARVVTSSLVGTAASFVLLSFLDSSWPLPVGIAAVALASVFVQGGNGAVFAMVPQIHKPVSGQIAGMAGSYGNIGGIAFSSVLFFSDGNARLVFVVVALGALVVAGVCARWLGRTGAASAPTPAPLASPTPSPALV